MKPQFNGKLSVLGEVAKIQKELDETPFGELRGKFYLTMKNGKFFLCIGQLTIEQVRLE